MKIITSLTDLAVNLLTNPIFRMRIYMGVFYVGGMCAVILLGRYLFIASPLGQFSGNIEKSLSLPFLPQQINDTFVLLRINPELVFVIVIIAFGGYIITEIAVKEFDKVVGERNDRLEKVLRIVESEAKNAQGVAKMITVNPEIIHDSGGFNMVKKMADSTNKIVSSLGEIRRSS